MKTTTREKGKRGKGNKSPRPRDAATAPLHPGFLISRLPLFPFSPARILPALILAACTSAASADGGAVLSQQITGPYRVTVFGSPSPLRAGPADLSVLVQDAGTGDPVLDRRITIEVTAASPSPSEAWVPPCCSMKTPAGTIAATHAAAQNKLLYAANLLIPASGPHEITVLVDPAAPPVRVAAEVRPPAPPLEAYWAYLAFPPLAIFGFALNQRLRRRSSPPLNEARSSSKE